MNPAAPVTSTVTLKMSEAITQGARRGTLDRGRAKNIPDRIGGLDAPHAFFTYNDGARPVT